jgi:hypothetical protein
MPRYYFDIYDDGEATRDDVGLDLPSMTDAVTEARRTLAGMVKDTLAEKAFGRIEIRIRDGLEGPIELSVTLNQIDMTP